MISFGYIKLTFDISMAFIPLCGRSYTGCFVAGRILGVLWWVVYWVFCGGPYTGCLVAGRVLGVLCKSCERYLVQAQKGT